MDKLPQEILNRLDALAAKLGVTVQYLWAVLIKQARVEVYGDLFFAVLFGSCGYLLWLLMKKMIKMIKADKWADDWLFFASAAIIAGIIGCLITVILNLYWCITPLFNPEYWALQQVIQTLNR